MSVLTHVGIGVPELEPALRWYGEVLGFEALGGVARVRAGEGHAGVVAADVLGPGFGSFTQGQLVGANGVGIELFEFEEASAGAPRDLSRLPRCAGRGPHGRAHRRQRGPRTSRIWQIFEGEPYLTCYCEDPFGNVVELYSHGHERVYSNR